MDETENTRNTDDGTGSNNSLCNEICENDDAGLPVVHAEIRPTTKIPVKIWNQIYDLAVSNSNNHDSTAITVCKILQCRKIPCRSFNERLLINTTSIGTHITSNIQYQLMKSIRNNVHSDSYEDDDDEDDTIAATKLSTIVKTILLNSSTMYDTPWEMCCILIKCIQNNSCIRWDNQKRNTGNASTISNNDMTIGNKGGEEKHNKQQRLLELYQSYINDIQYFLQQVTTIWWDEERKQHISDVQNNFITTTPSMNKTNSGTSTLNSTNHRRSIRPIKDEVYSNHDPQYWIEQLLRNLTDPYFFLIDDSGGTINVLSDSIVVVDGTDTLEQHTLTMMTALIVTIVSLCKDVNIPLFENALNIIFQQLRPIVGPVSIAATTTTKYKQLCYTRFGSWIHIAVQLRHLLRIDDWDIIYHLLKSEVHTSPCRIPRQDLSTILDHLFTISCMKENLLLNDDSGTFAIDEQSPLRWLKLILIVLSSTSNESNMNDITGSLYGTLERRIYECLTLLPYPTFSCWVQCLCAATTTKSIIALDSNVHLNILLLIWNVARVSTSHQFVSDLVQSTFNELILSGKTSSSKSNVTTIKDECWEQILQLLINNDFKQRYNQMLLRYENTVTEATYSDENLDRQQKKRINISRALFEILKDVIYIGMGKFERCHVVVNEDRGTLLLSHISCLIVKSLFIRKHQDKSINEEIDSNIVQRAQNWLVCVNDTIKFKSSHDVDIDFLACVVILVTLYFELHTMRYGIVQYCMEALSLSYGTEKNTSVQLFYITVITIVLNSSEVPGIIPFEVDALSDFLVEPMQFDSFCTLARALSPLPSARLILLSNVEKQVSRMRGSSNPSSSSRVLCPIRCNQQGLLCNFYSLILLIQRSKRNDYDVRAWLFLSDVIVENETDLPFGIRIWILHELKDSAIKQKFHPKVVDHLMRACLVRLIYFMRMNVKNYGQKLNEQPDEIIGIFDLLFTLLYCGDAAVSSMVRNRCRSISFDLFGLKNSPISEQRALEPVDLDDLTQKLTEDSVEANYYCVVTFFFLTIVFSTDNTSLVSFDGINMLSIDEIEHNLVKRERTFLDVSCPTYDSPNWIKVRERSTDSLGRCPFRCIDFSSKIHFGLCDMVTALLLGKEYWRCSKCTADDVKLEYRSFKESTLHLVSLLCLRRGLSEQLDGVIYHETQIAREHDILLRSFAYFCINVVPIMQENILNMSESVRTNKMLAVTLDLCERMERQSHSSFESISLTLGITCFRSIYTAVIEENAANRLIGYLEGCCSGGTILINNLSLATPDDIYCFVRLLRTTFFRCASVTLETWYSDESFCFEMKEWCDIDLSIVFTLESYTHFIKDVTNDLTIGLTEGKSGGLTHDLYVSMIDFLSICAQLSSNIVKTSNTFQTLSTVSLTKVGRVASEALEIILCSFAIHQATAFKKTLMLCTTTLPSVSRLIRHTNYSAIKNHDCTVSIARRLFDQLTVILKRKSEMEQSDQKCWDVLAGKDHLGGRYCFSDNDDEVSELSDGFTDVVKRHRDPVASDTLCGAAATILLRTERSWTWSYCCILEAFENDWSDSRLFMDRIVLCDLDRLNQYFEFRHMELVESVEGLCHFFQGSFMNVHTPGPQNSFQGSHDYVVHLPSISKCKICSTIDSIVVTLKKAIKLVQHAFQRTSNDNVDFLSYRSNVEAVVCLYTWLTLTNDGSELCYGVQRWNLVEKILFNKKPHEEFGGEGSTYLRRLPKLAFRIEELEQSLQKLSQIVQGDKKQKNNAVVCDAPVEKLDDLLKEIDPNTPPFHVLLSNKVSFLAEECRQLQEDFGLLHPENVSRGRKRNQVGDISKFLQRERRHKVLRSRNTVVDNWLNADRGTGEGESVDGDAYADLEDFLVDG